MRKSVPAILFFILIFSCQWIENFNDKAEESPSSHLVDFDLDSIVARGYLTALVDNSSTGLFLYKGQTMGYEYELLRAFTDSLKIDLKLEITSNLDEAFRKLETGQGDILAYNLTVTKERKQRISFSAYHTTVKQVLVQRKPSNWREMKMHEIEARLIRNPIDLVGKEVVVRYHSSYYDRMVNLSEEIGGDILIREDQSGSTTEGLIAKVANGEIEYTVAEEDLARVNSTYYPILDVETFVSFDQPIAWGLRKNADSLKKVLDKWTIEMRKKPEFYVIYNRYYRNAQINRYKISDFSSEGGGKISEYDGIIRQYADSIGWDWYLLAALIYKESRFNPNATSWAGATGLMQVMPATGDQYGIIDLNIPENNLKAGTRQIRWLKEYWRSESIKREDEIKFILASYNAGLGHVQDARKLTKKYAQNDSSWVEVSEYLLRKSDPEFYLDPIVEFGYCRGTEPVNYVNSVLHSYGNYRSIYTKTNENTDPQF